MIDFILLKNTDVFVSQKIVSIQFCSQQSAVLRVSDIMSLPEQPRHLARGVRKRRAGLSPIEEYYGISSTQLHKGQNTLLYISYSPVLRHVLL